MSLATKDIIDALCSHALTIGYFDAVNGHEPKRAPGLGLSAAVYVQRLRAVPARSGLASVSARLSLNVRCMTSMLAEPQDMIDPNLLDAVDALCRAYCADFTLGGLLAEVDLLGMHGEPLGGDAGYLNQDQQLYRVLVLSLSVTVNDLWTQVA